jgi:hypothetical protein
MLGKMKLVLARNRGDPGRECTVRITRGKVLLFCSLFFLFVLTLHTTSWAEGRLSPLMQEIENKYIRRCVCRSDGVEIELTLAGLEYGNTKNGSINLAVYATVKWYIERGERFPRPVCYAQNSVAAEIHFHCFSWLLITIVRQLGLFEYFCYNYCARTPAPKYVEFCEMLREVMQSMDKQQLCQYLLDRCNPINIGFKDKPPLWTPD